MRCSKIVACCSIPSVQAKERNEKRVAQIISGRGHERQASGLEMKLVEKNRKWARYHQIKIIIEKQNGWYDLNQGNRRLRAYEYSLLKEGVGRRREEDGTTKERNQIWFQYHHRLFLINQFKIMINHHSYITIDHTITQFLSYSILISFLSFLYHDWSYRN